MDEWMVDRWIDNWLNNCLSCTFIICSLFCMDVYYTFNKLLGKSDGLAKAFQANVDHSLAVNLWNKSPKLNKKPAQLVYLNWVYHP